MVFKKVGNMSVRVGKVKATVLQAQHAARMGVLAGHETSAAGRTSRRGSKGATKHDAILGQPLKVGRWYGVTERLDVPVGVVRMHEQDVDRFHVREFAICRHRVQSSA